MSGRVLWRLGESCEGVKNTLGMLMPYGGEAEQVLPQAPGVDTTSPRVRFTNTAQFFVFAITVEGGPRKKTHAS